MNRTLGLAVIAFWLSGLALLIQRDVLPYWRAQELPRGDVPDSEEQVSILDARDRRVGTGWVTIRHQGKSATWQSLTTLSGITVPGFPAIPATAIDTTLEFQPNGALASFETRIAGMGIPISMTGHLLGIDYSCLVTLGDMHQPFSLDARFSKQLGESLRPFTHLPNLHVGQSWQIRILDPMSLLMQQTPDFRRVLVTVTGLHTIEHRGRQIECFQVECDNAWAWVDRDGRVLVQTVQLPLLGKITLTAEPFDRDARAAARRAFTEPARETKQSRPPRADAGSMQSAQCPVASAQWPVPSSQCLVPSNHAGLVTGYNITPMTFFATRLHPLATGHWALGTGHWTSGTGHRALGTGHWNRPSANISS